MNCPICNKRIVVQEDWGDYDDAQEWACLCEEKDRKILVERKKHLIYFTKPDGVCIRYDLKRQIMQRRYIRKYKKKPSIEEWYDAKQQYIFFRNYTTDSLVFKEDKFEKMVLQSKSQNMTSKNLSTFVSRLNNVLVYENYINEKINYEIDYSYGGYSYNNGGSIRLYNHFKHGLEDYDKNIIKFFKLVNYKVTNKFEASYFENKTFSKKAIEIIMHLDITYENMINVVDTIIKKNFEAFDTLINEYNYDIKALIEYCANYLDKFENIRFDESIVLLRDYYRMSIRIGRNVKRYPKYLKSMHDIIMANYEAFKKDYDEILFKKLMKKELIYKAKEYSITIPKTSKDIISEGTSLNHCVSSYVDSILNESLYIFFLRKTKELTKSLVTLELKDGKITQAKGSYNRAPNKEELEFLEKYSKKVKIQVEL